MAAATPLLKVRTITVGITLEPDQPFGIWSKAIEGASKVCSAASKRFSEAGFEVQTTRISTNPFEEWIDVTDAPGALHTFRAIDEELRRLEVGLFSAGPATSLQGIALVPDVISMGPRISFSAMLADPLDINFASAIAGAILRVSRETAGGEGNFQFCASCNVPPGIPFFPAAYHKGQASFAIGCETSALVAHALPLAHGELPLARRLLIDTFEKEMTPVQDIARQLSALYKLPFDGIDASVAPFGSAPSLANSFESIGLGRFGESGTLAVASLVTGALKSLSNIQTTGYSGLMLPPCEDAGLAARASESGYRIHDLLAYSAVCGLGLDTVPVAGDISQHKLAALILDVAALAFRLNKPLTARCLL